MDAPTYRLRFLDAKGNEVPVGLAGLGYVASWSVSGGWLTCEYARGGRAAYRLPDTVVHIMHLREPK